MPKAPMTREEINASTQRKLDAINTLMKSLELSVEARERIDNEGFIKKIVYFNDHENYQVKEESAPVEEVPVNPKTATTA